MFEILEHPAGVGILSRGTDREAALIDASRGMTSLMVDSAGIPANEEREFRAPGSDHSAQVVNWLNEILFFFDTEGFVCLEFEIHSWTDSKITGLARGGFFNPGHHKLRTTVKAATFHQFESRPTKDGWEIRVFVDV